jgi:hypothetical protein
MSRSVVGTEPLPTPGAGADTGDASRYGSLTHPVVGMLVVAAIFHVFWGKPIDGVLTLFVAVAAIRARPDGRDLSPTRLRAAWPIVGVIAVVYGVVVGSWARFSWPTTVAVFLPGLVLLAIADRAPPRSVRPPPSVSRLGRRAWAALWLALCAWEVIAFTYQPSRTVGSHDHPTLSILMDSVLKSHPGRAITLAVWLAAGWALARR